MRSVSLLTLVYSPGDYSPARFPAHSAMRRAEQAPPSAKTRRYREAKPGISGIEGETGTGVAQKRSVR